MSSGSRALARLCNETRCPECARDEVPVWTHTSKYVSWWKLRACQVCGDIAKRDVERRRWFNATSTAVTWTTGHVSAVATNYSIPVTVATAATWKLPK